MSRITNIIAEVRDELNDEMANRYSDEYLLRQLNRGIYKANMSNRFLKYKSYVKLENKVAFYDLSDIAIEINRVQYLNKNLEVKSEIELDALDSNWTDTIGNEVKYVTMEHTKSGSFKIYPMLDNNVLNIISQNQVYGGVIDVDTSLDLYEIPTDNIISEVYKYLVVYYVKKPNTVSIDTLDVDLEFDNSYDDSLIYYITGKALRSDTDTQNRTYGTEQLGLFDIHIQELKNKELHNNNTLQYKEIPYRGFE